jgi:hypothetical protein
MLGGFVAGRQRRCRCSDGRGNVSERGRSMHRGKQFARRLLDSDYRYHEPRRLSVLFTGAFLDRKNAFNHLARADHALQPFVGLG